MMWTIPYILTIALCLAGCAVYAGGETAFVSINKLHLKYLISRRFNRLNRHFIYRYIKKPDIFLTTSLIGTNLCVVSASVLSDSLFLRTAGGTRGQTYSVIFISFIFLLFGEIIPKNVSYLYNVRLIGLYMAVFNFSEILFKPAVALVHGLSSLLFRWFNIDISPKKTMDITKEELEYFLLDPKITHAMFSEKKSLFLNAIYLRKLRVKDFYRKKQLVTTLNHSETLDSVREKALKTGHSRFPVLDPDKKRVTGIASIYRMTFSRRVISDITDITITDFPQITDTMPIYAALDTIRDYHMPLAVVVNQDKDYIGILSINDIISTLIGSV